MNGETLKLQNNIDKVTKVKDIGIYVFKNGLLKEINYYTQQEEKTNPFTTQTILEAPRDEKGKAKFLNKIEFTQDITPIMDSFENEECIISSSSQHDATNYMPWKAFRHHTNDSYGLLTVNAVPTGWLKIQSKNQQPKVVAFAITTRNVLDKNNMCSL